MRNPRGIIIWQLKWSCISLSSPPFQPHCTWQQWWSFTTHTLTHTHSRPLENTISCCGKTDAHTDTSQLTDSPTDRPLITPTHSNAGQSSRESSSVSSLFAGSHPRTPLSHSFNSIDIPATNYMVCRTMNGADEKNRKKRNYILYWVHSSRTTHWINWMKIKWMRFINVMLYCYIIYYKWFFNWI